MKRFHAFVATPATDDQAVIDAKIEEVASFLSGQGAEVSQMIGTVLFTLPNVAYGIARTHRGLVVLVVGAPTAEDARTATISLIGDGWSVTEDPSLQRVMKALPWVGLGLGVLLVGAIAGGIYWWRTRR